MPDSRQLPARPTRPASVREIHERAHGAVPYPHLHAASKGGVREPNVDRARMGASAIAGAVPGMTETPPPATGTAAPRARPGPVAPTNRERLAPMPGRQPAAEAPADAGVPTPAGMRAPAAGTAPRPPRGPRGLAIRAAETAPPEATGRNQEPAMAGSPTRDPATGTLLDLEGYTHA